MTRHTHSLDGKWEFELDPLDKGRAQCWWKRPGLAGHIKVPGCWQAQGFGGELKHSIAQIGHPPLPIERYGYKGTGWYRKVFHVRETKPDRRIWINFGGVHPRAEFWCNSNYLGKDPGGLLEFSFDITKYVRPGEANVITVRVFENDRFWASSYDGGIYNMLIWSGLYRSVRQYSTGPAWFESVSATPCLKQRKVRVNALLGSGLPGRLATDMHITVTAPDGQIVANIHKRAMLCNAAASVSTEISLDKVEPWSLNSPQLYQLNLKLIKHETLLDERNERFGMRDISVKGRKITLNGQPVFLRGYGRSMVFPRTLSPELEKKRIRKEMRTARDFGFNAIQFYCPPYRELLDAADETGMLIQVFPGDLMGTALKRRTHLEKMIRQTINHPSIIAYGWSAERYDNRPDTTRDLDRLYEFSKKIDPTRLSLARDGSHLKNLGHGKTDFEEPACCYRGCYSDKMLLQHTDKPVLIHELGWFSSYPNPALKRKYRNLPLLPFHITYAEETAQRQGFAKLLPEFVRNSEIQQAMERKMALECLRKVPSVSGFHLWTGNDNISAVEGVWDDFGDPKNLSADDCLAYNGDTVLLMEQDFRSMAAWVVAPDNEPETNPHDICRDWQGRNLWEGETLKVNILTSHYGAHPVKNAALKWVLTSFPSGKKLAGGMVAVPQAKSFTTTRIATLRIVIPQLRIPTKMVLKTELTDKHSHALNSWDFWGFPRNACKSAKSLHGVFCYEKPGSTEYGMDLNNAGIGVKPRLTHALPRISFGGHLGQPADIFSTRLIISLNMLSNGLIDYLEAGGRVWLLTELLFPEYFHRFRSIPWNQVPFGNSGTIVRNHPCLKNFPHEGFCDLQFYDLARTTAAKRKEDGGAINLDIWPYRIEPIIRSIDSYMGARNRGLLFETRVGRGLLMVSRLNFVDTPASRFLADEIVRYMLNPAKLRRTATPSGFLRNFVNQRG